MGAKCCNDRKKAANPHGFGRRSLQGRASLGAGFLSKGYDYELVVLGAGPVGVKAAIEAASFGVRSTIIDPHASITALPTGAHSKVLREAAIEGVKTWDGVELLKENAVKMAVGMTSRELKTFHIEVLRGTATVTGPNNVLFTPSHAQEPEQEPGEPGEASVAEEGTPLMRSGKSLSFHTLVIATGSTSARHEAIDFSAPGVYDSTTFTRISRIPRRLVVQGAGIIGLEYALIFKRLGCESVVVIMRGEKVAPQLDASLQEACRASLLSSGVRLMLQTNVQSASQMEGSTDESPRICVALKDGNVLECDCFLSATGRRGCTQGLGLETLGAQLKLDRNGFVEVDNTGCTGVDGIYAVGDVAGAALATSGQAQAQRAIWHRYASGFNSEEEHVHPGVVWSIPELAWVGMSEAEAQASGSEYGTVSIEFNQTMRGAISSKTKLEGFLKLVYLQEGGKVIGVHIFGEGSSENISFGADLVQDETTVYDLQQFVFPACTYHELYHRAAAEATLRIRHAGAKDVRAAAAWSRVMQVVKKQAAAAGVPEQEVLRDSFKRFDRDASGFISKAELRNALEGMGLQIDDETVGKMVQEATGGPDQDLIDYQCFLGVFTLRQRADSAPARFKGAARSTEQGEIDQVQIEESSGSSRPPSSCPSTRASTKAATLERTS